MSSIKADELPAVHVQFHRENGSVLRIVDRANNLLLGGDRDLELDYFLGLIFLLTQWIISMIDLFCVVLLD